jgi:hypothetical protein
MKKRLAEVQLFIKVYDKFKKKFFF